VVALAEPLGDHAAALSDVMERRIEALFFGVVFGIVRSPIGDLGREPLAVSLATPQLLDECVIHAMSVHGFTACRSRDFAPCRPGFHGMSVQHFRACRSSS
jgi:hypothetical protein